MINKISKVAAASIACILFSTNPALAWPEFEKSVRMEATWAAEHIVYNGMPMRIENFECQCQVDDVLDFYRARWSRLTHGYVENDLGLFQQISRGTQRFFFSVQVRAEDLDASASVGRLSIMKLPQRESDLLALGSDVPRFDGSEVITDIQDAVPGKRIRTVTLANSRSLVDNRNYYEKQYSPMLGWEPLLVPISPERGNQALSFQRRDVEINIVLYSSRLGTNVLFNEVKRVF